VTPERWAQIEELFHKAAECEPRQRAGLLEAACNGDAELRRQVEQLLASEESASDDLQAAVRDGLEVLSYPLVGEIVSHYRILDGLGGGGMGLVYRAEDVKLGRQVALKFLPEESAKDPEALGRFEREARSASALEHPNICPIYEFGEHDGRPFLVMQLLQGQTLRELIAAADRQKPPLDIPKLLDLALQISQGLQAAHEHGIIHRDIKPANIFVTNQGQAKILDFGLAKLSVGERDRDEHKPLPGKSAPRSASGVISPQATPDPLLSRTGMAMGTAGYMSPEQARGEKLDARTDLFSFGLVLYEMATGKRAFLGDTGPVLHDAILHKEPRPPRETNPALTVKLETLILKAIKKDREARYQSASALCADLQALSHELDAKPRLLRWAVGIGIVTLLAAVSGIVWLVKFRQPPPPPSLEVRYKQITTNSPENPVANGGISPDGKFLAYSDLKGLHVRVLETGEVRSIPQPAELDPKNVTWEILWPWLVDGSRFVANAHPAEVDNNNWSSENSSIWAASVLGSEPPQKIHDHATAYAVSPDGSQIAFGVQKRRNGESELWLMEADGQRPRKLREAEGNGYFVGFGWPADGKRFLYIKEDQAGEPVMLSQDVKGGPMVTIFSPSEMRKIDEQLWLHDGRYVYAVKENDFAGTCNYWARRIDWSTGKRIDTPRKLTNWKGMCPYSGSITADDKHLAFRGTTTKNTVYLADLDAGGKRILKSRDFTSELGYGNPMAWTPDGKSIIFFSARNEQEGIYKQRLDQDAPELIVTAPGEFHDAHISPDGKWVFWLIYPGKGEQPETVQLMRAPIAGGPAELVSPVRLGSVVTCSRMPSNVCVLAEPAAHGNQVTVAAFDPVKGRGVELLRYDNDPRYLYANCEVSPDGSRIAVISGTDDPIQILSLRGGPAQTIATTNLHEKHVLRWSADGRGLLVVYDVKGGSELVHLDLRGNAVSLWRNKGGFWPWGIPSPDGRHLAIQGSTTNSNMWLMENF
jgi:serine/threonine protein kinase